MDERERAPRRRWRGLLGVVALATLGACSAPDDAAKDPADDTGVVDTDPGDDTDPVDTDPVDTDDTDPVDTDDTDVTSALDELLADLRADRDATLLAVSRGPGWPAAVEGGWLFVTSERGAWSLAGDFEGWSGLPMTEEAGFSWIVTELDGPSGYKFTNGTDWNADPRSRAYTYDEFGEMSLVLAEGAHLERLFAVEDDAMPARAIRAWVPAEPATHVLYVHDGQNLFNPDAAWGGWHLQDSAPAAMLIVGLDNTDGRMAEYTHVPDRLHGSDQGGDGDAYAAYLQHTVRPLVADVWGEPATVGVMGSSLGGLISFHVADRYPGEYTFAASLSGTMGWGSIGATNETMIERYAAAGHRGTALYVDSGGAGTTCADSDGDGTNDDDDAASDNYCENIQLRDVLSDAGYTFGTDLWHWHEPGAGHNEAAWAARVSQPLDIFAGL